MINYYIYCVEDSHGNQEADVTSCTSNCIYFCNVKDENGEPLFFESDAYHLKSWCEENNLKFKKIEVSNQFPEMD